MDALTERALRSVLDVAKGDTRHGAICAEFLLAYWNAPAFGGFDPALIGRLPARLRCDVATIMAHLALSAGRALTAAFDDELRDLATRRRSLESVAGDDDGRDIVYL